MKGKLAGFPALDGNDIEIVVPHPVAGKSDPFPIRGKTWKDVSGHMIGQPVGIGSVLIGHPDVPVVTERNLSVADVGIADKLDGSRMREMKN